MKVTMQFQAGGGGEEIHSIICENVQGPDDPELLAAWAIMDKRRLELNIRVNEANRVRRTFPPEVQMAADHIVHQFLGREPIPEIGYTDGPLDELLSGPASGMPPA